VFLLSCKRSGRSYSKETLHNIESIHYQENDSLKKVKTISHDSLIRQPILKSLISCENPYLKSGELITHTYYELQYSEEHEQAYWVAYVLYPDLLIKNAARKNRFIEDNQVKTGSASLTDYKGSGFDRGHMAPAGAMVVNQTAMNESFYMSNMSPQHPSFNRGVWKRLESKVKTWAKDSDSLFVVTGPILNLIEKTIGDNHVSVPKQFYKVLVRFKDKEISGIAFLLKNEKSKKHLNTFAVTIDSIEELTGIDFNPNWGIKTENIIEGKIDINAWHF